MNNDDKTCSQCGHKSRCSQLYEKMGHTKGPNVAWKVTTAFLVPILVFIGSLAGATRLLEGKIEGRVLTLATFSIAAAVTLAVMVFIRAIRRRGSKSKMND